MVIKKLLTVFLISVSLLNAGGLNDFSDEAAKDSHSSYSYEISEDDKTNNSVYASIGLGVVLAFAGKFLFSLPFEESFLRMDGYDSAKEKSVMDGIIPRMMNVEKRENGEVMLPSVRSDITYESLERGIQAIDAYAEIGYGALGASIRDTNYKDFSLDESLKVQQIYALVRLTYVKSFEIDIALGRYGVYGEKKSEAFALSVPVLLHLDSGFGFEFRPVFSSFGNNELRDYTFDVMYDWKYVSLKAGARFQRIGAVELNGAQVGFSFHY